MILITGATGLTGAHLALHLLKNGEKVRAIYREKQRISKTKHLFELYGHGDLFPQIEWKQADINDIPALGNAFGGVENVFHCAAKISFNQEDEEDLRKTNIEGTANVVNLSLDFGVKKLIYVSSVAALGDLREGMTMVTEETDWNPESHHHDYAISKYGAEMEVWRGWQEGLQIAIVNPGIIIGPGFWDSGSGEIFSIIQKGLKFYTHGVTGYVDVNDVARAMYQLLKSEINGERFILVSENLSYKLLMDYVAAELKVKKPDTYARRWLTSLGWRIDWLLAFFGKNRKLSRDAARALHSVTKYSNEKIVRELDFIFTPIEQSVKETVRIQRTRPIT